MDELETIVRRLLGDPDGDEYTEALVTATVKAVRKCFAEGMGDKLQRDGTLSQFSEAELLGVMARARTLALQELIEQGWDPY